MARSSTVRSRATSTSHPASPTTAAAKTSSARSPSVRSPSRRRATSTTRASSAKAWAHTPTQLTLIWLAVSMPLVLWDTGYVLLRPYSMPGGKLHAPLWKPYALYSTVDLIYGWKAFHSSNGFTAAQSWMNVLEGIGYAVYIWMVLSRGKLIKPRGRGSARGFLHDMPILGELAKSRAVSGRAGAIAALLGFSCLVMTISKTLLYVLNEVCSGFDHTGHNDVWTMIFLYALPNGCWILFPGIVVYSFGREILEGLETASSRKA